MLISCRVLVAYRRWPVASAHLGGGKDTPQQPRCAVEVVIWSLGGGRIREREESHTGRPCYH